MPFAAEPLPVAATWARLQTFLAVYEHGSIGAAAEQTHVTAPAVTGAIRALEQALGTRLFARSGRGIVPTPAGEAFAGYARKLVGLLAESALALRDGATGRVRIGAVASAAEHVLPRPIGSFHRRYPMVEVSWEVLPRDQLFARAREHALDVLVAGRPSRGSGPPTGLVSRAMKANRLLLVAAPQVPADPDAGPWLLPGPGSGTRETALALLERHGLTPALMSVGTSGAAIAAAREGLGVALVHEVAVRRELAEGSLVAVAMAGLPLNRPWHLITAEQPTATARLLVDHLTDSTALDGAGDEAFHTRLPPDE